VPETIVFQQVTRLQRIILFITLIALGIAIIFIYIFSATLTSPLKELTDAAKYIQEGHFDVEVPAHTRDEIGMLGESFTEMARGLSEREKMKDALGKFVNKEIADLVLKDAIKLGGERKDVAVFFSDIRAFTSLAENMLPEEVVEFLNRYMTTMVNCVNQTGGVVDKFIGDSIMAVWGAPITRGNDTENAVNCALLMRKALIEFNKDRGTKKRPKIYFGIGINSGPVLAGQIGSQERMEYTVIGDTVNLASRIESLNKPFATDILISEETWKIVKNKFVVKPMKKIRVKGKREPQQIYAVLGRKDDPSCPKTLTTLRMLIGIDAPPPGSDKDAIFEGEELKYEIID
jgi:adenylate cyclase